MFTYRRNCSKFNIQRTVFIIIGQIRCQNDIYDMRLRTCIQIDLACDTCQTPEVLILKISTVAPAHNLHCYKITPWLKIFCYIKLGSHLTVLAIADELAIYPYYKITSG